MRLPVSTVLVPLLVRRGLLYKHHRRLVQLWGGRRGGLGGSVSPRVCYPSNWSTW